jgi:predicted transcriptional regulator
MQATREQFLALLLADPGLHLREAPRRLGVSLRTARYHLDALVREGRALRQPAGGFVRYFPAGIYAAHERAVIAALRVRNQRVVVEALMRAGPQRFVTLLDATGLARSTLAQALHRLQEDGVVQRAGEPMWSLRDPARCRMWLSLIEPRLSDEMADSADAIFGPHD